jgi:molecular chaperone GrpE
MMHEEVKVDTNSDSTSKFPEDSNSDQISTNDSDGNNSETDNLGSEELKDKVRRLEIELSEIRDKYLRNIAESENIRRRHERERVDLIKYAAENIVKDLLPVLDGLDTAVANSSSNQSQVSESSGVIDGFRIIYKQLLDAMKKHGLEIAETAGVPFDPNIHQAIQMIPSEEVKAETVASVFAKGYSIHGRVVRPAMVSVSVPGNSH